MATKRQGRAGLFTGASRTPRRRPAPTGPQAALAALKGVVYSWDMASDALAWGPSAGDVLGLSPGALPRTGRAFSQMIEPGSGLDRREAMASDERGNQTFDGRYALRLGPAQVLMVQEAGRWQTDGDGRPVVLRGLLRVDPGASAPDLLPAAVKARSAFFRRLQDRIDEAAQLSHTCTLVVGTFSGHEAATVDGVRRALRPMLRRGDHCEALGPDRFALTLACCPAREAGGAMKRAAALITAEAPHLSVHLGAACAPDHTFEAVKLLRFSEQALEKALSRSEPAVLHRLHQGGQKATDQASVDMVAALNDRRIVLAGRPLVDGPSRQPTLVQACPAIAGPDGRIAPFGPVPDLKEPNLALLVDARLLELAADHLARHADARLALPVAPATLMGQEWLPTLAAHLGARPGIASRLIVQVPEAILDDPESALAPLSAMKALGVGIGLTGFGTGHASLAALQSLPVDLAVIDGLFVQALKRSTEDRLFVRTVIGMGHHLGIAVAAEGVDDEACARLLSGWGIDYMDGKAFGTAELLAQPEPLLQRLRRA